MKISVEMPAVETCSVNDCAYNVDTHCHARAITVGDGIHPGCDTFLQSSRHTRSGPSAAGVGACKVEACRYNDDYECGADAIQVGHRDASINCLTFEAR
ncbi:DUF1540 domain-containing protein [Ectothiorhodospiraceae bacterium 2226]|nr:DUF1540 domain-containing protein [Ectothiorhodospiraceae bacterium 2226]